MVVAATDYSCARGRAECGRVELRIAQSSLSNPIQCWRRDHAAESATYAVALIVCHDQQDVGCSFWRHHPRWPPRRRFLGRVLNHAAERRVRRRKLYAANGGGSVRGAQLPGDLNFCSYGWRNRHRSEGEHYTKQDLSH